MNRTKNGSWSRRDRDVPYLCGSEIWAILCVIVGKINNMLLCVKIMLICACAMYSHANF